MHDGMFTSTEAAELAGCSYRRLHYMLAKELLHPCRRGVGSGNRTHWCPNDVRILVAFTALRDLGATDVSLKALESQFRRLLPDEWVDTYVVTAEGELWPLDDDLPIRAGWLIDLGAIMPAALAPQRVAA